MNRHTLPAPFKHPRAQKGLSLAELMLTMAIAIILLGLAAPNFVDFIQRTHLTNTTYALYRAMQLTRSEAIKRNARVDLVALNGNWQEGWQVMVANNTITEHGTLPQDIQVSATFNTPNTTMISYGSSGRTRTRNSSNTPQVGSIRLSTGKHTRFIIINFLGRARICTPTLATAPSCSH